MNKLEIETDHFLNVISRSLTEAVDADPALARALSQFMTSVAAARGALQATLEAQENARKAAFWDALTDGDFDIDDVMDLVRRYVAGLPPYAPDDEGEPPK